MGRTDSPKGVLELPVLVLNRNYQPIRVTTAQSALSMLFVGRGKALDAAYEPHGFDEWSALPAHADDDVVPTTRGALRVPRVLLVTGYDRVPRTPLRLSRRNIFLRDEYTCQYCGQRPPTRDLNLDHVTPRSRGGATTWENLVTSCRRCNLTKGHALPAECGMRPARQPRRPTWSVVVQLAAFRGRLPQWEPFLGGLDLPIRIPVE